MTACNTFVGVMLGPHCTVAAGLRKPRNWSRREKTDGKCLHLGSLSALIIEFAGGGE